jgi:hypothetical protein
VFSVDRTCATPHSQCAYTRDETSVQGSAADTTTGVWRAFGEVAYLAHGGAAAGRNSALDPQRPSGSSAPTPLLSSPADNKPAQRNYSSASIAALPATVRTARPALDRAGRRVKVGANRAVEWGCVRLQSCRTLVRLPSQCQAHLGRRSDELRTTRVRVLL